jgi:hypothetical protein
LPFLPLLDDDDDDDDEEGEGFSSLTLIVSSFIFAGEFDDDDDNDDDDDDEYSRGIDSDLIARLAGTIGAAIPLLSAPVSRRDNDDDEDDGGSCLTPLRDDDDVDDDATAGGEDTIDADVLLLLPRPLDGVVGIGSVPPRRYARRVVEEFDPLTFEIVDEPFFLNDTLPSVDALSSFLLPLLDSLLASLSLSLSLSIHDDDILFVFRGRFDDSSALLLLPLPSVDDAVPAL